MENIGCGHTERTSNSTTLPSVACARLGVLGFLLLSSTIVSVDKVENVGCNSVVKFPCARTCSAVVSLLRVHDRQVENAWHPSKIILIFNMTSTHQASKIIVLFKFGIAILLKFGELPAG